MEALNFRSLIIFSAFLHVLLIVYGEWQDTHMEVRYTDVDYFVFSDVAALVVAGKSPYKRSTYRYSPLIAYILAPNSFIHRSWGKFLFSASDLLVGYFIRSILKLRGVPENLSIYSVIVWLFNPFTFTIGTRGNCEPIICAIILWIILCIMRAQTHWLFWGYMLEFKGKQVFLQLWAASLLFFAANTYVMITIILRHTYSPVFKRLASILQIVNRADPSFRGQIQPPWILLNSTAVWTSRRLETKKGVVSDEMLRGVQNKHRSRDSRIG
ncbi:hypothetical protein E3N88_28016 [Mikania micrantha]|uniref:GPI mannosyltransferase 1 n=1 Tax=Mikania micrantha TaxID=192012 RepID=A0A5N6N162_9ASTR|nr:hypothetical protein E3N88_28016 [Mikania micrantha]